jgi:hypothetical protein
VPVLFKVATIFWATIALLPMPLKTNLPDEAAMHSTAFTKSSLMKAASPAIPASWIASVRDAVSVISCFDFFSTGAIYFN